MKRFLLTVILGILAIAICMPQTASAIPVDLELALLVDISGSVDAADFALQRDGYEAAFRDAGIISGIENGTIGSIAVTLIYWSDSQQQAIAWSMIDDATTANAFADAIAAATRPFSGNTGMADAVNFAVPLFASNGYEGTRSVIDISGDGADNTSTGCSQNTAVCVPLQNARDNAFASGIDTINALWIDDRDFFGDDPADIINAVDYGNTNIVGGPDSFSSIVQSFDEFAPAILSKLEREITPVPEPSALIILGSGLLGIAAIRRRVKK